MHAVRPKSLLGVSASSSLHSDTLTPAARIPYHSLSKYGRNGRRLCHFGVRTMRRPSEFEALTARSDRVNKGQRRATADRLQPLQGRGRVRHQGLRNSGTSLTVTYSMTQSRTFSETSLQDFPRRLLLTLSLIRLMYLTLSVRFTPAGLEPMV